MLAVCSNLRYQMTTSFEQIPHLKFRLNSSSTEEDDRWTLGRSLQSRLLSDSYMSRHGYESPSDSPLHLLHHSVPPQLQTKMVV